MATNKDKFDVFEEVEQVEKPKKAIEIACQTDEAGFVEANEEASEIEEIQLTDYWKKVMSSVKSETDRYRKMNDDLEREIALATLERDAKKDEYEKKYAEVAGDLEAENEESEDDDEDSIIVKI